MKKVVLVLPEGFSLEASEGVRLRLRESHLDPYYYNDRPPEYDLLMVFLGGLTRFKGAAEEARAMNIPVIYYDTRESWEDIGPTAWHAFTQTPSHTTA